MYFVKLYINALWKKEKEKKMFIQVKNILYYNVNILKNSKDNLFRLKYNSDTSCRKKDVIKHRKTLCLK